MPPKKKEEEIDINTLPPWQNLKFMILFNCAKRYGDLIKNFLNDRPRDFQRNITRTDVINFAKEKQMYIDPATMTDKQKKDKTLADIPQELTPAILAKAFMGLLYDFDIKGRVVRLEIDHSSHFCLGEERKDRR
jgi:hypothetical protein